MCEMSCDVSCDFASPSEIEDRIEEAKEQIVGLREELQKSRVIRKHRQEYDALAKV